MSNKDNFGSGFVLGSIIGGLVGGVIGTLIANKNKTFSSDENNISGMKNISSSIDNKEDILETRINLEDKINQLNHAIDEVRFTLLKNGEKETSDQ